MGTIILIVLIAALLFPRLFADVRAAQRLITWQVYWFKPGKLATQLADTLAERARAGVEVRHYRQRRISDGSERGGRLQMGQHSSALVEHASDGLGLRRSPSDEIAASFRSYTLRHQTEELEAGQGARGFMWASIGVAQQF